MLLGLLGPRGGKEGEAVMQAIGDTRGEEGVMLVLEAEGTVAEDTWRRIAAQVVEREEDAGNKAGVSELKGAHQSHKASVPLFRGGIHRRPTGLPNQTSHAECVLLSSSVCALENCSQAVVLGSILQRWALGRGDGPAVGGQAGPGPHPPAGNADNRRGPGQKGRRGLCVHA